MKLLRGLTVRRLVLAWVAWFIGVAMVGALALMIAVEASKAPLAPRVPLLAVLWVVGPPAALTATWLWTRRGSQSQG